MGGDWTATDLDQLRLKTPQTDFHPTTPRVVVLNYFRDARPRAATRAVRRGGAFFGARRPASNASIAQRRSSSASS